MKSCYSVERFVKVEPKRELPLIHTFLNKHVKVKIDDDFEVSGLLICYQMENKSLHKPSVLVLKDDGSYHDGSYHFLRGSFISISEVKP